MFRNRQTDGFYGSWQSSSTTSSLSWRYCCYCCSYVLDLLALPGVCRINRIWKKTFHLMAHPTTVETMLTVFTTWSSPTEVCNIWIVCFSWISDLKYPTVSPGWYNLNYVIDELIEWVAKKLLHDTLFRHLIKQFHIAAQSRTFLVAQSLHFRPQPFYTCWLMLVCCG